jgi:hypothetical protein
VIGHHADLYSETNVTRDAVTSELFVSARQNDMGFPIRGPVVIPRLYDGHDKTFFFASLGMFLARVLAQIWQPLGGSARHLFLDETLTILDFHCDPLTSITRGPQKIPT